MNISQYIKSNNLLKHLDFPTVYDVIIELLKDKKVTCNENGELMDVQTF